MSEVVVDGSVFGELLFPESFSDQAAMLVADAAALNYRLVAPVVVRSEMTNAIRRRMRLDRLDLTHAAALLDRFLALPILVIDDPDLYREALILTEAHSLTAYDAQYVALA